MIAPKKISLTINGKPCEGESGQTILEVARANGAYIPTLCYMKQLSPWGGCRLCIVELEGNPRVLPSCSTPATDGSKVITHSDRLVNLRKVTLELLFSERNHICPICPLNKGDCGLQHQGYAHGIDGIRFPYLYPALPVDLSAKYFGIDHNRCILCTRCVRTCDEIEGVHTLDIAGRGERNRVVVDLGKTFGESPTCTLCGACVANCPTGALSDKASAFRGPLASCQQVLTTCTECPVGCGLKVFTKEGRIVNVWGDPDSTVNQGHLCVKGRYGTWAEPRPRITQPMLRRNGQLEPATWDEALRAVKAALKEIPAGQRGLLVSPRFTNEAARTVRQFAGTVPRIGLLTAHTEAGLCAAAGFSADALAQLERADAIILLGTLPSRDNGVIAAKIRQAVRKRGAKLLIFQARKSDLDFYADVAANVVSLEHALWEKVAEVLGLVQRPVVVYGPQAMSPIGITVLERLIQIFESKQDGQSPGLIGLPLTANSLALATAGIAPVEDLATWLTEKPLGFLQIAASDEPDGGARILADKRVGPLLQQIRCLVVQAGHPSELTAAAAVVLPAADWYEKSGTVTNLEGRQLPVRAVLPASAGVRSDESILEAVFS